MGQYVQWGPQESLMEATLPGFRTMNPCPVWEQKRRQVFLFFICVRNHVSERQQICRGKNAARLCFVSSSDEGRSWSQIRDLTEEVIGEEVAHWATFAVGPGHGLQLQSGRLVIPAYAYRFNRMVRCLGHPLWGRARPHSLMFYSDDLGATWEHGQLLQSGQTIECEVAEVMNPDGCPMLYCSARTPGRYRAEALSADQGEHFGKVSLCCELREPRHGCQGSVVSFQSKTCLPVEVAPNGENVSSGQPPTLPGTPPEGQDGGKPPASWLLYSHPTSSKRRLNLGIYLNRAPLEAVCWSQPWILHKGPSGYSDLAVLEEGLFGCLFECGEKHETEQITFQLFTDQELLKHISEDRSGLDSVSNWSGD